MKRSPYDERNEADYIEMSRRIEAALKMLTTNWELPATEEKLAELAKCSRGTLRNRHYPLVELRNIKHKRKQRKKGLEDESKSKKTEISEENKIIELEKQLKQSRDEASVWVKKYKDLEDENKKFTRINKLGKDEILSLRSINESLNKRISEIEKNNEVNENRQNVFFIKNAKI